MKLNSPAAPASGSPTIRLTAPGQTSAAEAQAEAAVPEEQKGKKGKAPAAPGAKAEPGVVFLILSIVALLIMSFTILISVAQYCNMYEGSKVKLHIMEQPSLGSK